MFKPGFQFAPGYRIQRFLGRGQFGQVWQVEAPGGTSAAVKFIDLTEGSSQKEYDGIKRVKQIRQANLMPITAIWQLDQFGKAIGLTDSHDDVHHGGKSSLAQETLDGVDFTVDDLGASDAGRNLDSVAGDADASQFQATASFEALPEPAWLAVAMLLGGKSLRGVMRDYQLQGEPGIPFEELISYMQDTAKGLDFLNQPNHDLGNGPIAIQHCDVKPANIVTVGNSAMICDFGLAKILSRNQATATTAAGTPAYMAPEAIGGKPSRTSDQYSLAITYCELRTGKMPVEGNSVWEVIDKHREGHLNFDAVPQAEREILRKATHLDWQSRYESCSELVDQLRDAYRGISPIVPAGFGFPTKSDGPATGPALPPLDETTDFSIVGESKPKSKQHYAWWAAAGTVAIVALAFAFTRSSDSSTNESPSQQQSVDTLNASDDTSVPDVPTTAPEVQLAEVIALYDKDEKQAIDRFEQLLIQNPSDAEPTAVTIQGNDPLQAIWLLDGNRFLTLGYEPTPKLFDLPKQFARSPPLAIDLKRSGEGLIYPEAVAVNPNRSMIALGGRESVCLWNLNSKDFTNSVELPDAPSETFAMAWHPTKPVLVAACADGTITVWEIAPPGSTRHQQFSTPWVANQLKSHPNGAELICRTDKNDVLAMPWSEILLSLETQMTPTSRSIKSHGTEARVFANLMIDGDAAVAVGDLDGAVTLWKLAGKPEVIERTSAHNGSVESITVASGELGEIVGSCGSDGSVHLWNVKSKPTQTYSRTFSQESLTALALSQDQRWIATGGYGAAWLWDWNADKAVVCKLEVGKTTVHNIAIDPSEQWIVAACDDGRVHLWDLRHAKLNALTREKLQLEKLTTPL